MDNNYIINEIREKTTQLNMDNLTRTHAYQLFYQKFKEIKWSFLASMVSRNAGWNMTDLETPSFKNLLPRKVREELFSTYERANWLIFSDAYPQLLIYQVSKELKKPLFDLLQHFSVSSFMIKEWFLFWENKDENRLLIALIINEQNVIESPVTKHPYYLKYVFLRWPYLIQNFFHLNAVIFPNREGEVMALKVNDFVNLTKRIILGKKLARILFNEEYYPKFWDFALATAHTGSRKDYGQYLSDGENDEALNTPRLRSVYPVITHKDKVRSDWFVKNGVKQKWWRSERINPNRNYYKSFTKKRLLMSRVYKIKSFIYKK